MSHAVESSLLKTKAMRRDLIRVIALSLLLALLASSRAAAQGTMGMLPGPISTVELDGYAQRLALSPQQRRAIDALHDQYKDDFRSLRDGEIAAFLTEMRELDGGGTMPKRKAVEDFLRKMDALSRKIGALDNQFFDRLQPILTEQQVSKMYRVRLARQRGRMDNMQMMWMGGQKPTDVSAIVFAMQLPAADAAAVDPLLAQYESRLTSDMERMYESSQKTILGMYDALESIGMTEESMQDPEKAEEIGEAMQQVWMDIMAKGQKAMAETTAMNDRAQQSIAATLSPDSARAFRNRYHRTVYPEATFALYMHDYVFAPALKRDDLTDAQREAVVAARDNMLRSLDVILDEAVAQANDWRTSVSPFEYDQKRAEDYQRKQAELRARADAARAAANASLEAALGAELLNKVGRLKTSAEEPQDEMMLAAEADGVVIEQSIEVDDDDDNEDEAWGVDQFLPAAIPESELGSLRDRLELTDEQMSVARDLHRRYMESFQKVTEAELAQLQKAVASMWQYDEETDSSRGPSNDAINETYRLRNTAFEAIKAADSGFYDELELAVLTPEQVSRMPRVRSERERVMYNRGGYYWGNDSNESAIDISRFIGRRLRELPEANSAAVEAALAEYEQRLLPLLKQRYAKSLEAQKVQELWSAEMTRAQMEGEGNNFSNGMKYQEMMKEPQRALAEASDAIGELNRETIAALVDMLPAASANRVRSEYNRRAFPNVYGDGSAVDEHIDRARSLNNLTPQQVSQLNELAADYMPAYALLCSQMVAASEGSTRNAYLATIDEDGVQDWQKREEALAKLRFDRSELNARAASRLRGILSEFQLKSVGGLPAAEDYEEFD